MNARQIDTIDWMGDWMDKLDRDELESGEMLGWYEETEEEKEARKRATIEFLGITEEQYESGDW